MLGFEMKSSMPVSGMEIFRYHTRPGAFQRLLPPWQRVEVTRSPMELREGARLEFLLRKGPLRIAWHATHRDCLPGRGFTDVQTRGPFHRWTHVHRFLDSGNSGLLVDSVQCEPPLPGLLSRPSAPLLHRALRRLFRFRHQRTRFDLSLHRRFSDLPRKTVVFFGAMTPLTREMAAFLSTGGHRIFQLEMEDRAGENCFALKPFPSGGRQYPLDEADVMIHTNRPYRSVKGKGTPAEDYLEFMTRAMSTMAHRPGHLVHLHWRFSAPDFTDDPGIDFGTLHRHRRETEQEEDLRTSFQAMFGKVVHFHLGHLIGPPMSRLVDLLLELETYLFLRRGARSLHFHWISRQDAVGALNHLLFQEQMPAHVAAVSPQHATRAHLQRLLIKRNFPGYSFHRLLRVLPWAMPGLAPDRDSDLSTWPSPALLGYEFLTPDLETALALEFGEVITSWPGAYQEA